jgi:hypothetical protein
VQPAFGDLSGSLLASQFPALTGDVTTAAGSLATTIAANAVTYAKMQNETATTLLGRGTATGVPQEITLGTNLSMSGTTLNATGAAGGTPGGSNTQVQYNNSSAFGGITNATSDGTTMTLTSPKVITAINDTNGNAILKLGPATSAVNQITVNNAATGSAPYLSATGTDTNLPFYVAPKGNGWFEVGANVSGSVTGVGGAANIGWNLSAAAGETDLLNGYDSGGPGRQFSFCALDGRLLATVWGGKAAYGGDAIVVGSTFPSGAVEGYFMSSAGFVEWNNDTALHRNAAGVMEVDNGTAGTIGKLVTRRQRRISSTASTATLAPDISANDVYYVTALAAAMTINNPIGSPVDSEELCIAVHDNGTARAITWGAAYSPQPGKSLPSTTVINSLHYWVFRWVPAFSIWILISYY